MDLKEFKDRIEVAIIDGLDANGNIKKEYLTKVIQNLIDYLDYYEFEGVSVSMIAQTNGGQLLKGENSLVEEIMTLPVESDYLSELRNTSEKLFQETLEELKAELIQSYQNDEYEDEEAIERIIESINEIDVELLKSYFPSTAEISPLAFIVIPKEINVVFSDRNVYESAARVVAMKVIDLVNGEKPAIIDELNEEIYPEFNDVLTEKEAQEDLIPSVVERIKDMMNINVLEDEVVWDLCLRNEFSIDETDRTREYLKEEMLVQLQEILDRI